jgi:hypothetical protein
MPIPVTRYKCEHCLKKTYASKYDAIKHEKLCFFNPETKSCVTCENAADKVVTDFFIEDIISWCYVTNNEIYVKGRSVINCLNWRQKEYEFYSEDKP